MAVSLEYFLSRADLVSASLPEAERREPAQAPVPFLRPPRKSVAVNLPRAELRRPLDQGSRRGHVERWLEESRD